KQCAGSPKQTTGADLSLVDESPRLSFKELEAIAKGASSAPRRRGCGAGCGSAPSQRSTGLGLPAISTPCWLRSHPSNALLAGEHQYRNGPKKKSPGPVRIPATGNAWNFKTSKERAMGLEPTTSSLGRRRKNKG